MTRWAIHSFPESGHSPTRQPRPLRGQKPTLGRGSHTARANAPAKNPLRRNALLWRGPTGILVYRSSHSIEVRLGDHPYVVEPGWENSPASWPAALKAGMGG